MRVFQNNRPISPISNEPTIPVIRNNILIQSGERKSSFRKAQIRSHNKNFSLKF